MPVSRLVNNTNACTHSFRITDPMTILPNSTILSNEKVWDSRRELEGVLTCDQYCMIDNK